MMPRYSRKYPSSYCGLKQNRARMPAPMLTNAASVTSCRLLRRSSQRQAVPAGISQARGTEGARTVISEAPSGRRKNSSLRSMGSSASGWTLRVRPGKQTTHSASAGASVNCTRHCPGEVCVQPVRVTAWERSMPARLPFSGRSGNRWLNQTPPHTMTAVSSREISAYRVVFCRMEKPSLWIQA